MQPNPHQNPQLPGPPIQGWNYEQAFDIAQACLTLFEPICLYAAIAGSVRRKRPYVKDIEIVCTPHQQSVYEDRIKPAAEPVDLFSEPKPVEPEAPLKIIGSQPVDAFIDLVNGWEKIKGDPTGRYTQRKLPEGIAMDLFIVSESDFFRMFAMRTGSADFSHKVISTSWVKKGWRGTADGLRLHSQCEQKGDKFICTAEHPVLPPVWKSEEEFFRWLGLKWIAPENRY